MSASWLTPPVQLHSSREFSCDSSGFTSPANCTYYTERWRFWYVADHVYGLSTVAFFMCAIGVFIVARAVKVLLRTIRGRNGSGDESGLVTRARAAGRYLSYRGFRVERLGWNSAPLGVLILGVVGGIFFFCMDLVPRPYYWESLEWGGSPPLATRSGWMALGCMPFVFATASKANWITLLTGVSHEKLQVFHRWTAYAFFILALMHTFPFIVYHIRFHDMMMQWSMMNIFYWTGVVALLLQAWLTFASFSLIRNLGYEFFKATHFIAVALFVVVFFWHCDYTLSSWDYFIATAAVYVPCLVYPWLRTIFEYRGRQKARVSIEENGFTRIDIPVDFTWVPGQHCFLRFGGFGLHNATSHPFTICSLPANSPRQKSETTFFIRHRGGLTRKLHDLTKQNPSTGISIPVSIDGPYGGISLPEFYSSDRLLLIAGGSGAGWTLPFIELFARCVSLRAKDEQRSARELESGSSSSSSTVDEKSSMMRPCSGPHRPARMPRSLRVILATREPETRAWFHCAVTELLARYPALRTSSALEVHVYLTGRAERVMEMDSLPELCVEGSSSSEDRSLSDDSIAHAKDLAAATAVSKSETRSDNANVESFAGPEMHGRPHLPEIVREEAAARDGEHGRSSLGVFVCGPEAMQNDVRNAVARENLEMVRSPRRTGEVYLHVEHFSWA